MQFVGRIKMSKNPFTKRATECSVPHSPSIPLSARVRSYFVSSIRIYNCIITIYMFLKGHWLRDVWGRGEVKMRLWSQTCINMLLPLELLLLGLSHGLFAVRYGRAGWGCGTGKGSGSCASSAVAQSKELTMAKSAKQL